MWTPLGPVVSFRSCVSAGEPPSPRLLSLPPCAVGTLCGGGRKAPPSAEPASPPVAPAQRGASSHTRGPVFSSSERQPAARLLRPGARETAATRQRDGSNTASPASNDLKSGKSTR
jgi:hypothetical protein